MIFKPVLQRRRKRNRPEEVSAEWVTVVYRLRELHPVDICQTQTQSEPQIILLDDNAAKPQDILYSKPTASRSHITPACLHLIQMHLIPAARFTFKLYPMRP